MSTASKNNSLEVLQRTSLYPLHVEHGARLVPFAGYEMPVQYSSGIKKEHIHTRTHTGLFDVSHMGQVRIAGENAGNRLELLVPGDICGLRVNQQRYSVLTNQSGGIIDDLMITRMPDYYFLVVNAACKEKDLEILQQVLAPYCQVDLLTDRSLLALQGPEAANVLRHYIPAIDRLGFLTAGEFELDGIACLIHRCGYTGEDGFEISIASDQAEKVARILLEQQNVRLIGLGARDSLRLEAGLCLYGHDIDEATTPVAAGLDWVIAAKYKKDPGSALFPGAAIILSELDAGPERLRVGLMPEGKIPVREGTTLYNLKNDDVGHVTSGGFGPTLGRPVAMGYVSREHADPGTRLTVEIRNRTHNIEVTKLPFITPRYYNR